jgi:hypothetical protein
MQDYTPGIFNPGRIGQNGAGFVSFGIFREDREKNMQPPKCIQNNTILQ